ncbi:MAG: hypothetical protein JJU45_18305 [Acidimicrobiia bacterium]|nr:hypothetical protein [Acidimicrobiia bacterium]
MEVGHGWRDALAPAGPRGRTVLTQVRRVYLLLAVQEFILVGVIVGLVAAGELGEDLPSLPVGGALVLFALSVIIGVPRLSPAVPDLLGRPVTETLALIANRYRMASLIRTAVAGSVAPAAAVAYLLTEDLVVLGVGLALSVVAYVRVAPTRSAMERDPIQRAVGPGISLYDAVTTTVAASPEPG